MVEYFHYRAEDEIENQGSTHEHEVQRLCENTENYHGVAFDDAPCRIDDLREDPYIFLGKVFYAGEVQETWKIVDWDYF